MTGGDGPIRELTPGSSPGAVASTTCTSTRCIRWLDHGEGHRLFLEDDAAGRFRITATKGTHVKGNLRGSPGHFNRLETAFNDEEWRLDR